MTNTPNTPLVDALEQAWRDGWALCKGSLTDDEAFCLTEDVEQDAWLDSTTRASLPSSPEPETDEVEQVGLRHGGANSHCFDDCIFTGQIEEDGSGDGEIIAFANEPWSSRIATALRSIQSPAPGGVEAMREALIECATCLDLFLKHIGLRGGDGTHPLDIRVSRATVQRCLEANNKAAALSQPQEDSGLVEVPREPTEAMLQGACEKHKPGRPMRETTPIAPDYGTGDAECPRFRARRRIWADMIAAAPTVTPKKEQDK